MRKIKKETLKNKVQNENVDLTIKQKGKPKKRTPKPQDPSPIVKKIDKTSIHMKSAAVSLESVAKLLYGSVDSINRTSLKIERNLNKPVSVIKTEKKKLRIRATVHRDSNDLIEYIDFEEI